MIKLDRKVFLEHLKTLADIPTKQDYYQDSSCLTFYNSTIQALNQTMMGIILVPYNLDCKINAQQLISVVSGMQDDTIQIGKKDGKLVIKGRKSRLTLPLKTEGEGVLGCILQTFLMRCW